jgi:hypothetical protein
MLIAVLIFNLIMLSGLIAAGMRSSQISKELGEE